MRNVRLACLAFVTLGTACAAGRTTPARPLSVAADLGGVWESASRATLDDGIGAGDTRIERQAWRLEQRGGLVTGYYVVEVTMISGDGRPYLCSREPRFSTLMRFEVRGRVTAAGVELEEVGDLRAKGPCRPTSRAPARYRAAVRGDVLALHDGERRLLLFRRAASETATARFLLAFDGREDGAEPAFAAIEGPRPGGDETPANVAGVWVWEHRGMIPTGDEKVEREEWHLTQEGSRVSGYYDRAIRQISTDGHAYRCNSALDFRIVTRYQITGEVRGSSVILYERGFEILEASPCDDGRRRLDAYQGQASDGELRLVWGVGTQILRRARPNVPTQRF